MATHNNLRNKSILIVVAFLIVAVGGVTLYETGKQKSVSKQSGTIKDFEDCAKADNPLLETFPEQCQTPDGRHFIKQEQLSEETAIRLIKTAHPELSSYPAEDVLPPTYINTEPGDGGWYAAFVQAGSGRPIIQARCFFVKPDMTVIAKGTYTPEVSDNRGNVHARDCTPFEAVDTAQ